MIPLLCSGCLLFIVSRDIVYTISARETGQWVAIRTGHGVRSEMDKDAVYWSHVLYQFSHRRH